ncbi:MAG: hypothetical protein H0V44_08245 [Planctomycetes bacterium]|nr:hypothetical protein [Planctomycetota bacterium]
MIRTLMLAAIATVAPAAATIDLDLVRLRALPEAPQVRARLDGVLSAEAKARLQAMDALFGFDPRRDLVRVVVHIPDAGAGSPSVRLFGLPARRIASALSFSGSGVALPGGLTGYTLPKRPQALFVAIADDQALIAARSAWTEAMSPPAAPAASGSAISIHGVPGPHPRIELMTLVSTWNLQSDASGHTTIAIAAADDAAAVELERRLGVIGDMIEVGAQGRLARPLDAKAVLAASTVTRSGATLGLDVHVPADIRSRGIDRLIEHIGARAVAR